MPVRRRPQFVQGAFWRWWLEYFSVKVAYQSGQPLPAQQYIYCFMPHGLYPFSGGLASVSKMVDIFPQMRFGVAAIGCWIPIIRQLMGWIGCIPASKSASKSALRQGDSIAFFPGGIAEMVKTDSARERLVLMGRQGVVKLALEQGIPIVPVFVFGQSIVWSQVPLPAWVQKLSRFLRISIMFPYGRFGLLLPRKMPLLYCIGAPISCPRVEGEPSEDQVKAIHMVLVKAVQDIYDTYKSCYGWQDRPLSIE